MNLYGQKLNFCVQLGPKHNFPIIICSPCDHDSRELKWSCNFIITLREFNVPSTIFQPSYVYINTNSWSCAIIVRIAFPSFVQIFVVVIELKACTFWTRLHFLKVKYHSSSKIDEMKYRPIFGLQLQEFWTWCQPYGNYPLESWSTGFYKHMMQ